MAISMNLYYRGENGNAKKFVDEMISSGTVDLIRSENGNICYEYYQSISNPEVVLLIDSWVDQEAIDIHHSTPMMKTIMELREKYDLHMEAKRFVSVDNNSKDEKYLRK